MVFTWNFPDWFCGNYGDKLLLIGGFWFYEILLGFPCYFRMCVFLVPLNNSFALQCSVNSCSFYISLLLQDYKRGNKLSGLGGFSFKFTSDNNNICKHFYHSYLNVIVILCIIVPRKFEGYPKNMKNCILVYYLISICVLLMNFEEVLWN